MGPSGSRYQPTEVAELVIDQRRLIATFETQRDFGSTPGGLKPPTFPSVDVQAASRVTESLTGAEMNSEYPSRTIDRVEHRPHIPASSSAGASIERPMASADGSQTSEGLRPTQRQNPRPYRVSLVHPEGLEPPTS